MTLEHAMERAHSMIADNGPHRLSENDRQAVETVLRAAKMFAYGVSEEECQPLKREDVA